MSEPTDRQLEVFFALMDHLADTGSPPTVRELGTLTGITSSNGVCEVIARLERKRLIERCALRARGIRVRERGWLVWSEELSRRYSRTVSSDQARLLTHLRQDLDVLGRDRALSGLRDIVVLLELLPAGDGASAKP